MTTYKFLAPPKLELVRGVCGIGDDLRWRGGDIHWRFLHECNSAP